MNGSINIQFHMLLDEMIDFVAAVSKEYSLSVDLERWGPSQANREVSPEEDLVVAARDFGHIDRIWLLYRSARMRKPERFMLNVGTFRGKELSQAQLGAGTDKKGAFEILKRIAAELRRRTTAGVWVVSPTGHAGFTKAFRISPGAAAASRAGQIELKNIAFGQLMTVDPPTELDLENAAIR
ncbi:MAG: hypothetical protein LLG01_12510 [Planctomycetaceae bacterium]|nr:hypothetical protein [Planctomycetaceae bacterium]